MDVSKAIDKRGGNMAGFTEFRDAVKDAMQQNGISRKKLQDALGNHMLSHYLTAGSQPAVPVLRDYRIIRDTVGLDDRFDELFNDEAEREVVGQAKWKTLNEAPLPGADCSAENRSFKDITAPATEAARQWQGWGTALKPSLEPITVARKPLIGTVAANVLQHRTGAVNVDGCKVDGVRLPANFIHDGSEEAESLLGEAARFFYCAKADASERRNSKHPTIKPVALMRYLVRLVTPPGGLVLDPFGGSGTTAEAARLEHCRFLLMELNAEYCADAAERLRQGVLF